MLKTLLKKQMLELNRGFFYNQKNGAARSKASCIVMIVLFALLMVGFLGGLFTYLAFSICGPLVEANVGWLYFSIFGLLSLALGVLGSVFNTYSGLYLAKDNELLLSLPIPVRYLLMVRLLGVYLMGLMYSAVAILPAVVVYYIVVPVDIAGIVGPVVLTLLLSLLVLFLSCLLGWVVAKLSTKLKSKSFISALLALAFIAAYYFVYFKASALLRELVQNAAIYGDRIHAKAYLLYLIGRVGEGDWLSMLLLTLIVAILLGATLYVLAKTFLQIATAQGGVAKAVYKAAPVRRKSVFSALLSKELRRFSSSANYMLRPEHAAAVHCRRCAADQRSNGGGCSTGCIRWQSGVHNDTAGWRRLHADRYERHGDPLCLFGRQKHLDRAVAPDRSLAGAQGKAQRPAASHGDPRVSLQHRSGADAAPGCIDSSARHTFATSVRMLFRLSRSIPRTAKSEFELDKRAAPDQIKRQRSARSACGLDLLDRSHCSVLLCGRTSWRCAVSRSMLCDHAAGYAAALWLAETTRKHRLSDVMSKN